MRRHSHQSTAASPDLKSTKTGTSPASPDPAGRAFSLAIPSHGTASLSGDPLDIYRGSVHLLKDLKVSLVGGEVVALLGANGAGKSTLLSSLAGDFEGLRLGDHSNLRLNGHDLQRLKADALARMRAVLPQSSSLSFQLSVVDVLEMGLYPFAELSQAQQSELIAQAIEWADIESLRRKSYLNLSGGEKQRVQFGRVMVQLLAMRQLSDDTLYFLLDEPTSSLDPKYQNALLRALRQLSQLNIGILVILHDVNLAALHCDRLLLLANHGIIATGTPQETLTPDHLYALYGVRGEAIAHPFYPDKCLVVWY